MGGGGNGSAPSGMGMASGAAPSGFAPSGSASALPSTSSSTSSTLAKRTVDDDGTWLRGGYPTNANGLVEFEVSASRQLWYRHP